MLVKKTSPHIAFAPAPNSVRTGVGCFSEFIFKTFIISCLEDMSTNCLISYPRSTIFQKQFDSQQRVTTRVSSNNYGGMTMQKTDNPQPLNCLSPLASTVLAAVFSLFIVVKDNLFSFPFRQSFNLIVMWRGLLMDISK